MHSLPLLLVLVLSVVPLALSAVSSTQGGLFFSPTVSSGFPLLFQYSNGSSFVTTPGYYSCSIGGSTQYAGVWSSNPAYLQCSYFLVPSGRTSGQDVILYGNSTGTPVTLATWTGEYDNSVQPNNQYDSFIINNGYDQPSTTLIPTISSTTASLVASGVLYPKACSPNCAMQLNASVWHVCVWTIYGSVDGSANSALLVPETGVTNFTVTSGTTGHCPSPTFTTVPAAVDVPFLTSVYVVAEDGSFDSSLCGSVGQCNTDWYFWSVVPSSSSPSAIPCNDNDYNVTVTASAPFQTQLLYSHDGLDYGTGPNAPIILPPYTSIIVPNTCTNNGVGGNTTNVVTVAPNCAVCGTSFTLFETIITQVNLFVDTVSPSTGASGTVVTVTGTFWVPYRHTCIFGGVSVVAAVTSPTTLTCVAPLSSATDGSGSFVVLANGAPFNHQTYSSYSFTYTDTTAPTTTSTTSPASALSSPLVLLLVLSAVLAMFL